MVEYRTTVAVSRKAQRELKDRRKYKREPLNNVVERALDIKEDET